MDTCVIKSHEQSPAPDEVVLMGSFVDASVDTKKKKREYASVKDLLFINYLPYVMLAISRSGYWLLTPLFLREEFGSSDSFIGVCSGFAHATNFLVSFLLGKAVARFGYQRCLQMSCFAFATTYFLGAQPQVQGTFLFSTCLMGMSEPMHFLAHHAFMCKYVPVDRRGKAMSAAGGTFRMGSIVGPLYVAGFVPLVGLRNSFYLLIPTTFIVPFLLFTCMYPRDLIAPMKKRKDLGKSIELTDLTIVQAGAATEPSKEEELSFIRTGPLQIAYDFRALLCRVGFFIFLLNIIREGMQLMIPLTGMANKLTTMEIATCTSAQFICGSSMFPFSGLIMDNCGRRVNATTAVVIISSGFMVMSLTDDFTGLLFAGILVGTGNGLASGLQMTLGSDTAPNDNRRSPYLGIYNMVGTFGKIVGPLIAGGICTLFGVRKGALVLFGICLFAAVYIVFGMKETLVKKKAGEAAEASI